jgi:hypothetical protein
VVEGNGRLHVRERRVRAGGVGNRAGEWQRVGVSRKVGDCERDALGTELGAQRPGRSAPPLSVPRTARPRRSGIAKAGTKGMIAGIEGDDGLA